MENNTPESEVEFVTLDAADLDEARETLCLAVQLLRGWHEDGTSWTPHDTEVLDRILKLQNKLNYLLN